MKWLCGTTILVFLLTGCSSFTVEPVPSSPYYMPPVGSIVIVNERLTVPGGWARVFLQRGSVVSYGGLDRYYPSCNFELNTVKETPQVIEPGRFTIVQVRRRIEEIVQHKPMHYASLQIQADTGMGDSGPSMYMHTVRMNLESEERPNMYMMTCRGALDDPPDAEHISINEMREALGRKATILLPDEK